MSEDIEHKAPKKRRRWPWITLVVILAIFATVRLALRADFVFDYIRVQAEQIASDNLDGELTIQRMRGDLWSHIEVFGVAITQGESRDTVATIDSISVGYNILSLLASPFVITGADVFGLNSFLVQDEEGTWNYEKVLPIDEEPREEPEGDSFPLRIERAQIHSSNVFVNAPLILPDTTLQVRDINLLADFEMFDQGFSFSLENLGMDIHEGRFQEPIRFETTASGDTTAIQLDRLVISGASSFFELMADYNMETEELDLNATLDPLSWRAIRAYADESPLNRDIIMRLNVSGDMQNLQTRLETSADGMEQFTVEAALVLGVSPALTNLSINAQNVDFAVLLGDPEMPSFYNLESSFEGKIPLDDYQNGTLDGFLTITGLSQEPYLMERIHLNVALLENQVFTNLELNQADGMVYTEAHIQNLWDDQPEWEVEYRIESLNPALWAANEELEGMVQGSGSLSGRGFEFGQGPINFRLNLDRSIFQQQIIEGALLKGWVNNENIHAESEIQTQRNTLSMIADAAWAADEPTYSFNILTRNFDISEFIEDTLFTQLNLSITGQGRNFDLGTMELSAYLEMDSSLVNNEKIDLLNMNVGIRDSILILDDFIIRSQYAEGDVRVRYNLLREDDLHNMVDFDFRILDLQPFADLAGAEVLDVQGSVTGQLQSDQYNRMVFTARLDFHDLAYDTVTVEGLQGQLTAFLDDSPDYEMDIVFNRPGFGEHALSDINFSTTGSYRDEAVTGNYLITLIVDGENGLRQAAEYHYAGDSLQLTTTQLDLVSEEGDYVLENPFTIYYANELVRVDTLMMRGLRTGSLIQLALDQYGPEAFRGYFNGNGINLGLLQDIFLDEVIFLGMLDSNIDFDINPDDITIASQTVLWNFVHDELELDSLQFHLDISDKRLRTDFRIKKDFNTLLVSEFDLPFELKDPQELSEEFFHEPVYGYVNMDPLDLSQFSSMLEEIGMNTFTGVLTLNSTLSGTAGSPDFDGEFLLREAILSDIPVQEMAISWDYEHEESRVSLSSYLDTETQRAFNLSGTIPLYVDFRTFEFSGPVEGDEVNFSLRSNDLDLATFSEFLDPEVARDLRGLLNADITVQGPADDLSMEGYFRITEGRVRAVPNEVTFRNIGVDISLEPGRILLNNATVQSAGNFIASGEVGLNGFVPENFNIRMDARNFRVFATRDIDAYIGTDSRLHGDMESPILTGNLRIERGTIYLDDFGDADVETVVLDDEVDEPLIPEPNNGFYEDLAMEMTFTIQRNFFLRNRGEPEMDLALAGNLDLVKLKGQDVEIFGDITIPSGYATTFGKRFEIDSGTLVFSGDPGSPQMDIRTVYRPRQQGGTQIEIFYSISGTVDDPEFTYSSNPEMEFQDIISYTLFGRPFNALAGWEQGAAGRSESSIATDLAMEVLLDRVEALAADQLGIDVLEIDNTRRGPGSGTSIKAGKFLTDRVFVSFLQELGGTDSGRQVSIEYLIRHNLDLLITGSDDHRSGVDLLWRLDY